MEGFLFESRRGHKEQKNSQFHLKLGVFRYYSFGSI